MRYGLACLALLVPSGLALAQNGITLEGTVTDAGTNAPLTRARVKLVRGEDEPRYVIVGEKGRFRLDGLAPAAYILMAESPGFLDYHSPIAIRPPREDGTGKVVTQAIPLIRQAVIAGKVTDSNGVPLDDARVDICEPLPLPAAGAGRVSALVLPDGKHQLSTRLSLATDDRGEYRASGLRAGVYYVVAANSAISDAALRRTYFPSALDLESARPLELVAGAQARADIEIIRKTGVRVAGRIVAPDLAQTLADPQTATVVRLTPLRRFASSGDPLTSIRSGEFEFRDVLPGAYRLTAAVQDVSHVGTGRMPRTIYGALQPEIEIGAQGVDGLTINLESIPDLTGTVAYSDGCERQPVRIRVMGSIRDALPAPDGSFVVSGLEPGRYRMLVSKQYGNTSLPAVVRVGSRDVTADGFDFPLPPKDTLQMTVSCAEREGR